MRQIDGAAASDRSSLRRAAAAGIWSSFANLDDWQDPVLIHDAEVVSRGVGRFKIRANTDDLYHVLPARESAVLEYISSHLREGDIFVDAGANIGFYTIYASKIVGPKGRVIAVEMMPDTADVLRNHIELNGLENVEVIAKALSEKGGDFVIASVPEGKFGQASISRKGNKGARRIRVETSTLNHIIDQPVRLLKMDLEGAEFSALKGGLPVLNKVKAIIFEELSGDARARQLLIDKGFLIHRLDSNNLVAESP